MYSKEDTICAISTPPGKGAIAVIRCSGPDALAVSGRITRLPGGLNITDLPANTIHYGTIHNENEIIDQVVVSIFRKPHSYSGEDTVEISCHGSPFIQKKILELLVKAGGRLATAGEFTMRAFLNGKLDLTQVEAVADLIASGSEASHRIAIKQMRGGFTKEIKKLRDKLLGFTSLVELELDFSEEDVEFADRSALKTLIEEIILTLSTLSESFTLGNVIKHGIPVAIAGKTNAGKSTLLNLLLKEEKAIVSDIAGTTRDSIEDVISIRGLHFRLIDTAGLRHTEDVIEKLGIERTWQKISQAYIILQVLDNNSKAEEITQLSEKLGNDSSKNRIIVLNKIDRLPPEKLQERMTEFGKLLNDNEKIIPVSALNGTNLTLLEAALIESAGFTENEENDVIITNVRHFEALDKALSAMKRAEAGLTSGLPGDLLAQDIRETIHYLGEITGEITTDEVLGNIFKNFCIGK
ncbi:MAG TPA: tRNA uridine-5-carboxymethylaminomethyl(34) synthesis GTPase MnmE [Bacteroidales bacterium]|nr:tRNA uridine-5-carboxymethylaminomethyl(34) synthesis GTPase MnmE [Bacteroidales bacterium]